MSPNYAEATKSISLQWHTAHLAKYKRVSRPFEEKSLPMKLCLRLYDLAVLPAHAPAISLQEFEMLGVSRQDALDSRISCARQAQRKRGLPPPRYLPFSPPAHCLRAPPVPIARRPAYRQRRRPIPTTAATAPTATHSVGPSAWNIAGGAGARPRHATFPCDSPNTLREVGATRCSSAVPAAP